MLTENKFSKYLIYAIGEIVLVVIGIFIALQLNSWKSELEESKMEISHLQNIREDLQAQLEIIDAQILHEKKLTSLADSAYSFFRDEISIRQLESILYGSSSLGHRKTFIESNSSFMELLSTGGLHLIKDVDLRREMMRYQKKLEYTSMVINKNNGIIDNLFNTLSSSNAPSFSLDSNGDLDTTNVFNGKERYRLKHSIKTRINLCQLAIDLCELQQGSTDDLISKIDSALEE